jgi:glycosyltransferase involved in cell wall biosynthesis
MTKKLEIELSIVATCYNDATILPLLVKKIEQQIEHLNIEYEIILINDYSTDNTETTIENICNSNRNVKAISLSRNFGQQIAMSVGMRYSHGRYVLILDGDLQNPPEAIPDLYNKIIKGYDIVYTVSNTRNGIFTETTSLFFWFVISKLFKVDIVKNQLMLKIMNRGFVEKYKLYTETNRTVAGIVKDISSNYSILLVENKKRIFGKSNYNFFQRFNLMLDVIIDLTVYPLNFMIYFGIFTFFFTCFFTIYFLYQYLFYQVPSGYTSVILLISFFGSIIILLLGFIGKYLSNIYIEVKNRPFYHIKNTFNL